MSTTVGPLRLAVERYVHCPLSGMVHVERCAGCSLMQGSLIGERPQILCAYPEPTPALQTHLKGANRNGTQGTPKTWPPSITRRAALAMAQTKEARAGTPNRRPRGLIFDSDWPNE